MFNLMNRIISCSILIILQFGCDNYKCSNRSILATYVGFVPSEIDTFVIRRYEPNTNYTTLIDTFLIFNAANNGGYGNGRYTTSNDTTIVFVNDGYPDNGIFPGFDWKIFLPATGKTILISNIIAPQKLGSQRCDNPINSFVQDGVLINSPSYFNSGENFTTIGYRAYIHP